MTEESCSHCRPLMRLIEESFQERRERKEVEARLLETVRGVLKSKPALIDAGLRKAIEILDARVAKLKEELGQVYEISAKRNREMDALHFVWCTGGCASGIHRYGDHGPLTEEVVEQAELYTRRLRQAFKNYKHRAERGDAAARKILGMEESQ